jgi:hypothetical protein
MFAAVFPGVRSSGATAVEEDPTGRLWTLTAIGICAKP